MGVDRWKAPRVAKAAPFHEGAGEAISAELELLRTRKRPEGEGEVTGASEADCSIATKMRGLKPLPCARADRRSASRLVKSSRCTGFRRRKPCRGRSTNDSWVLEDDVWKGIHRLHASLFAPLHRLRSREAGRARHARTHRAVDADDGGGRAETVRDAPRRGRSRSEVSIATATPWWSNTNGRRSGCGTGPL